MTTRITSRTHFMYEELSDFFLKHLPEVSNQLDIEAKIKKSYGNKDPRLILEKAGLLQDIIECDVETYIEIIKPAAKYYMADLRVLWDNFDTPIEEDENGGEVISEAYFIWGIGTSKEDIWDWFDVKCPNGLAVDLMYLNEWR